MRSRESRHDIRLEHRVAKASGRDMRRFDLCLVTYEFTPRREHRALWHGARWELARRDRA